VRVEVCVRLCFFVKKVLISTENVFRETSINDNLYFAILHLQGCKYNLNINSCRMQYK
jgi:hypothetical protein